MSRPSPEQGKELALPPPRLPPPGPPARGAPRPRPSSSRRGGSRPAGLLAGAAPGPRTHPWRRRRAAGDAGGAGGATGRPAGRATAAGGGRQPGAGGQAGAPQPRDPRRREAGRGRWAVGGARRRSRLRGRGYGPPRPAPRVPVPAVLTAHPSPRQAERSLHPASRGVRGKGARRCPRPPTPSASLTPQMKTPLALRRHFLNPWQVEIKAF